MSNQRLRIVWWNVQDFGKPRTSAAGNVYPYDEKLDTIGSVIAPLRPDVFVLQEVYADNQDTMPFTLINKLRTLLAGAGLNKILYPQYLGVSNTEHRSMVVFFNADRLTPNNVAAFSSIKSSAQTKAPSHCAANTARTQVYVSKILANGNVYKSRSPILSQFTVKATSQTLNLYSIHGQRPDLVSGLDSIRQNQLLHLMKLASGAAVNSDITVIGGDFNGSVPTGGSSSWINCFQPNTTQQGIITSEQWKGVNNTHTVRSQEAGKPQWSLSSGKYPSYGYLNQALDKVLLLQNGTYTLNNNYAPWIVNPVLGSAPTPVDALTPIFGYLGATPTGKKAINAVMENQKSNGLPSVAGESIFPWTNPTTQAKYDGALNQTSGIKNLFYASDHFPVALDITLPTS